MMAFYGLTDDQILQMPIKRFWLLNSNLPRIQAADHRMMLSTIACARHGELISSRGSELDDVVGTVIVADAPRDRDAIKKLKALSGAK